MYNVRASKRSVVNTCRAGSGSLPTPPSRSTQEPVGIGVTCLAPCSSMQLDRDPGEGKFSPGLFSIVRVFLFSPPCSLPLSSPTVAPLARRLGRSRWPYGLRPRSSSSSVSSLVPSFPLFLVLSFPLSPLFLRARWLREHTANPFRALAAGENAIKKPISSPPHPPAHAAAHAPAKAEAQPPLARRPKICSPVCPSRMSGFS